MAKIVARSALVLGAALLILSLLFVSSNPIVAVQRRPSAEDIQVARQVWRQLKLARGEAAIVRADNRVVAGLSTLARDASGIDRIDADLSETEFRGRASIPLPLGLWLNASASATGSHSGFPPLKLTVGRVTLPTAVGRLFANLARSALRMKGADIPPLDEIVQSFSITRDHLVAEVEFPSKTALVDGLISARSSEINHEQVEATFCRIAAEQRAKPVQTLSRLVQRTFENGSGDRPDHNRASFVALSLAVAGDRAEALLPRGAQLRKKCPFPDGPLILHGRTDLAKHWVLSAALTSILGEQAAGNLGEWKELDDSLPDGSGFSFVDLAADRAGVQTALLALAPQTAVATSEGLSRATDDYMLPEALLQAPEGLSHVGFVERFGSLEQKDYRKAVFRIDSILAEQRRQQSRK